MIWRVWARIAVVVLAAVIPLFLLESRLQEESLQLAMRWSKLAATETVVDSYLATLKELAHLRPSEEAARRQQFKQALEHRRDLQDLSTVGAQVASDLRRQSLLYAACVLMLSLAIALLLARRLVRQFSALVSEREAAATKIAKTASLESWQATARMLVHEIRGQVTPLSLVASDLETRYATLPPPAFRAYLAEGTKVLREQTQALTDMVTSFTSFSKLPQVAPKPTAVRSFLDGFLVTHGREFAGRARMSLHVPELAEPSVPLDPRLLQNVILNLVTNACEANLGHEIQIDVTVRQDSDKTLIMVHNTGVAIPPELVPVMFEPRVSTKSGTKGRLNMGLGLTIAKKIALDHGGDLTLSENDPKLGVTFQIELPHMIRGERKA